jgi:hypothetical protein
MPAGRPRGRCRFCWCPAKAVRWRHACADSRVILPGIKVRNGRLSRTLTLQPRLPTRTASLQALFPNAVAAKLAIADALGLPLGRLPEEQRAWIDALLHETLDRAVVLYQLAAWRLRHQGRSSRGHD